MSQDQVSTVDFFESARRECPTHFGITAVPKLFPDTIAVGTIHNAISAKAGPPYQKVNGRVVLERDSFLAWLVDRPRASKRVGKGKGYAAK